MGATDTNIVSSSPAADSNRALSVLLSQALVAFTIEFDNEFELRMGKAGYRGARLSLIVWTNVMRFIGEGAILVRDLAAQALAPDTFMKFQLGCLERWGFIILQSDPSILSSGKQQQSSRVLRPGWGSGRGIRTDWMVRVTTKGLTAIQIWPPLFAEIEQRWEKRFGKEEVRGLQRNLQNVVDKLDIELPHGLPLNWMGADESPPRVKAHKSSLPLPTLLSQLLLMFRLEFDRESPISVVYCANTLRVLGEKPIRIAEIPRLTGISPETSAIGWQLKPYVIVESDPAAKRGKVARLSSRGLNAQQTYHRLIYEIEKRWEERFGKDTINQIRNSLVKLFDKSGKSKPSGSAPLLSEGLVALEGTVRAGDQSPALGRRDVGAAAKQRMRDLVAQTQEFIRDPAGSLPHYPSWDMNRGFGP